MRLEHLEEVKKLCAELGDLIHLEKNRQETEQNWNQTKLEYQYYQDEGLLCGGKEAEAIKRKSMDLTRALSKMRQGNKMQNYKVEVKSKEEQMEAVDLFIKLGYERKLGDIPSYLHSFVCTDKSGEILISSIDSGEKEITLQELRTMVTPNQKEYIVKTDTGEFLQVLSDVVDCHDGVIQVPEGAMSYWECDRTSVNFFSKIEKGSHFYHYLNKNSEWALWNDADFKTFEMKWQCESLNDQVASAEKARQEQAQVRELSECDLIDSGKLIIGGLGESFPVGLEHHKFIQPEELPFVGLDTKFATEYQAEFFRKDDELDGDLCVEYVENAWNNQIGGDHYKKLAIQPMEYALQNKLDYAQANVVKYVTRHADKNGKQDLLKAIHNIELMIAHYYSDQE